MCKCTCGARQGEYPSDHERITWNIDVTADGCWTWTGGFTDNGYGRIYVVGKGSYRAHRLAYETFVGPIAPGLTIDHLCRNKACVNPEHLEAVSLPENIRRRHAWEKANAARTTCRKGHPYTEENTYRPPSRGRECRTCRRMWKKRYAERAAS